MAALFACTKCHGRHPLDELSQGELLCKNCRFNFPIVKCTYCRVEFQQEKSTHSVCKKCAQNVKAFGKPSACEYCSIIAAFIGNRCQRCANSEKKWGAPKECEQCKQRCAFERDKACQKKIEGKLLCWLCTQAYKRVLAKARNKIDDTGGKSSKQSSGQNRSSHESSGSVKNLSDSDLFSDKIKNTPKEKQRDSQSNEGKETKDQPKPQKSKSLHNSNQVQDESSPAKKSKVEKSPLDKSSSSSTNGFTPTKSFTASLTLEQPMIDPNSSDHIIAITQLREELEAVKKQLQGKDQQLLEKEKKIGELKAHQYEMDKDFRTRIQALQKQHNQTIENLQIKNRELHKQKQMIKSSTKGKKYNSPST